MQPDYQAVRCPALWYRPFMALALISVVLGSGNVHAADWFRMTGSVGLSADYLQQSHVNTTSPSVQYRTSLRTTITLFDQVTMPFDLYLTSGQVDYRQPFNQFGVSPRISDWLRLHAGYFSMRFSEFTMGDVRIIGGGAELTISDMTLSAFHGFTRLARPTLNERNFLGEYERRATGAMIALTTSSKGQVRFNTVYYSDDPWSIPRTETTPPPASNQVYSVSADLPLTTGLTMNGEVALGVFTADRFAPGLEEIPDADRFIKLFDGNSSTRADVAGRLRFTTLPVSWMPLNLDVQFVGPGYTSMGYSQLLNDVLDITVSPTVNVMNGDLSVRTSLGRRINNVYNTRQGTIERFIGSLGVNSRLSDKFSVDMQYSNYGVQSNYVNDSLRVANISHSLSFTPTAYFEAWEGNNSVTLSVSWQQSSDLNRAASNFTESASLAVMVSHNYVHASSLTLTTAATMNGFDASGGAAPTSTLSVNETVSRAFFERQLQGNLSIGFTMGSVGDVKLSTQLLLRAGVTWNTDKYGNFSVNLISTRASAAGGVGLPGAPSVLQGGIQYMITL